MRRIIIGAILLVSMAGIAHADYVGPNYMSGTVTAATTVPAGLLVMISGGVPTNCTNTPYGWMLIQESNKTMVATALSQLVNGKKNWTVYTSGIEAGWCVINQVQPEWPAAQ